jgi:hypothetical protein
VWRRGPTEWPAGYKVYFRAATHLNHRCSVPLASDPTKCCRCEPLSGVLHGAEPTFATSRGPQHVHGLIFPLSQSWGHSQSGGWGDDGNNVLTKYCRRAAEKGVLTMKCNRPTAQLVCTAVLSHVAARMLIIIWECCDLLSPCSIWHPEASSSGPTTVLCG